MAPGSWRAQEQISNLLKAYNNAILKSTVWPWKPVNLSIHPFHRDNPPEGGASNRPHDRKHPLSWVPKVRMVSRLSLQADPDFKHPRAHYLALASACSHSHRQAPPSLMTLHVQSVCVAHSMHMQGPWQILRRFARWEAVR